MKAEALVSISENYRVLQLTWESAKDATTDTEMKARILGVASQTEKFDFFAVELGRKILKQNRCRHVKDRNLFNLYPFGVNVIKNR